MSELKPCPFCGGNARMWASNRDDKEIIGCSNHLCVIEPTTEEYMDKDKAVEAWNTRAAPVVPELVRYRIMSDTCAEEIWREVDTKGEYVLYSQAAEIIAAKDEEVEEQFTGAVDRMSDDCIALKANSAAKDARIKYLEAELDQAFGVIKDRSSECKELAAKLAQYEAQEPVGSYEIADGEVISTTDFFPDGLPYPDGDLLLYASPAPAADLQAERDAVARRLEKALIEGAKNRLRCEELEVILKPFSEAAELALISGNPPANHIDASCFMNARAALNLDASND